MSLAAIILLPLIPFAAAWFLAGKRRRRARRKPQTSAEPTINVRLNPNAEPQPDALILACSVCGDLREPLRPCVTCASAELFRRMGTFENTTTETEDCPHCGYEYDPNKPCPTCEEYARDFGRLPSEAEEKAERDSACPFCGSFGEHADTCKAGIWRERLLTEELRLQERASKKAAKRRAKKARPPKTPEATRRSNRKRPARPVKVKAPELTPFEAHADHCKACDWARKDKFKIEAAMCFHGWQLWREQARKPKT